MAVYRTEYEIGEEVWRIIKVWSPKFQKDIWTAAAFVVDKITITGKGLSYHCYKYSDIGESWIFGNRVLYRDREEVDKEVAKMNLKILENL